MLSLGSGVAAVSLMALAAVLGARWKAVESLFGGLDRVYETHKWLGVWALVFASLHLVFKAGTPEWQTAAILPLRSAAEARGSSDFSPLWSGQNTSGCRDVPAATLTMELVRGVTG